MSWTTTHLTGEDGADLHVYTDLPKTAPRAIVQINHGMAEHANRYQRFANQLVRAGYGVWAHDHRGHGYTNAPNSALGVFARRGGWEAVLSDVLTINKSITNIHPGVPVVAFGHSMGSIIALNHALREPQTIQGLVAWNSGVETGILAAVFSAILRIQRMFKGSDVPSGLAHKATFEAWNKEFAPNRTDFDWLSRDPKEVDKYANDPLCGFPVSVGLWLDVLQGVYFAADDNHLDQLPQSLPVHLLAGGDDPCSERGRAVENIANRMVAKGLDDVTLEIRPNTRHESLNDINRDETVQLFINWLDARYG